MEPDEVEQVNVEWLKVQRQVPWNRLRPHVQQLLIEVFRLGAVTGIQIAERRQEEQEAE